MFIVLSHSDDTLVLILGQSPCKKRTEKMVLILSLFKRFGPILKKIGLLSSNKLF